MILFNVRCRVLEPLHMTDANGHDVVIEPGYYRLRGIDHLVKRNAGTASTGMDISLVDERDGGAIYALTQERLAELMVEDDVEVTI